MSRHGIPDVKDETTDDLEAEIEDNNSNHWDDTDTARDSAWQRRIEEVNTASGLIGQRLLQGWTLLADHCSTCQTPMMSLNTGPQICVLCENRPPPAADPPIASTGRNGPSSAAPEREQPRRTRGTTSGSTSAMTGHARTSAATNSTSEPPPATSTRVPRPSALRVRRSEEVEEQEDAQEQEMPRPRNVVDPRTLSRNRDAWDGGMVEDPGSLRRNLSGVSNRGRSFHPTVGARQTSNRTVTYSQTETELKHQLNHTMYQFTRKLYQFNMQLEQCESNQIGSAISTLEHLIRGMRMVRTFRQEMGDSDDSDMFGRN